MKIKSTKKYGVFVSSTYKDLIEERKVVSNAILTSGHIPMGMELFTPDGSSSIDIIKASIDNSDFLLLIIAGKYGSICDDDGIEKSYVEMEYDYAKKNHKRILLFYHKDISKLPVYKVEEAKEKKNKLAKFLSKIQEDVLGMDWIDGNELERKVLATLGHINSEEHEMLGWIRVKDINADILNMDSETCTPFLVFSQEKRPLETLQSNLLANASKFYFFVKTGVTFFSAYERQIINIVNEGCEFRFLTTDEKYIQAVSNQEELDMYYTNIKKTKQHLKRIINSVSNPQNIEIKSVDYVPTLSLNFVEKKTGEKYILVQQYFITSRVGRDRPMFLLNPDNEWFDAYYKEMDDLWAESVVWDLN